MIKLFYVNIESGEIQKIFEPSYSDGYIDGEIVDGLMQKVMPFDTDVYEFSEFKYWDSISGDWATRTSRPSSYHNWTSSGWILNSDRLFEKIRDERNVLLKQSDWSQLPDAPLTEQQKTEWQTYRQALRNVPLNNNNVTSLDEVVWPTPPTV